MSRVTRILKLGSCAVGGASLGFAVGVGLAVALGIYERWKEPNDPSAYGSGLLIGALTIPAGILLGLVCGARVGQRWAKGVGYRGFDVVHAPGDRAAR
jgi:ethanolamine transporter EutH